MILVSGFFGGKHFSSRLIDECTDAHAVERAPYKENRNQKEAQRQNVRQGCVPVISGRQANSQFYSQQPEQRRKLDYRIQRYRRSVLKRIANGVANNGGIVKGGA